MLNVSSEHSFKRNCTSSVSLSESENVGAKSVPLRFQEAKMFCLI